MNKKFSVKTNHIATEVTIAARTFENKHITITLIQILKKPDDKNQERKR